jgi:hypothetical protein
MASRLPTTEFHRHRALARTLHARLWISAVGRVFVARSQVDFEKLRGCLRRHSAPPTAAEAPTPAELGLSICDGELTEYTLHAVAGALVRWSRALDEEIRRRPAQRRPREKIDSERDELVRLTRRLAACQRWQLSLRAGVEPAGMPLLLDAREEDELRRALSAAPPPRPFPPLVRWLARVVCWLSGSHATSRFLQAVSVLADRWDELAPADHLARLQRRLHTWKQRSRTEPPFAILTELRHALAALPPQWITAGKLSARLKGRTVSEHCDLLAASCLKLRSEQQAASWRRLPAALAAWAAADGGAAPLPPRMISAGVGSLGERNFDQWLKVLAQQFGQKAYDALLIALQQLPEMPTTYDTPSLRELLARGARLDDLAWAAEHGQLWRLAECGVRPALARRLVERFAHVGVALKQYDVAELVRLLATHQQRTLVHRWIGWIGQFSGPAVTPRLARLLASAGRELILPAIGDASLHETLGRWLDPPPCPAADIACHTGPLGHWLRRTAAYQALSGERITTPPSVRKVLRGSDPAAPDGQSSRAIRAAQEALVPISLDALRKLLARRCAELWLAAAGCELPDMSLARALSFARWAGKLDEPQRKLLREVGTAWTRHGGDFKVHLPQNQAWIGRLKASSRDPSAWLQARSESPTLAGQPVIVSIARDPREILLMGEYFATCLSIGQVNEMAALANAHDANKQVVFVVGKSPAGRRQVVARQLIAITAEYRLLGYRCYVAIDKKQPGEREACIALVASFCGSLARRVGLMLANEGEPDEIGSHFWYDDGVFAWHPAAQEAWNAEDQRQLASLIPPPEREACAALAEVLLV